MQFKNILLETSFKSQPATNRMSDSYDCFLIKNTSFLTELGFKLVDEHEKDGVKIEDFQDEEKNDIRIVNSNIIFYKKIKSHIFNWSLSLKDLIQNIKMKENNKINVSYYFNFPIGRFSDKGIVDILSAKNIKLSSVLDNNIRNNIFYKEQFFDINKDIKETISNICDPLSNDFSELDLLEIGYLKSSRGNSYFIEDSNYHYQNNELPNVIFFDENSKPIAKKIEKQKPTGHLITVNLIDKTIEHKANKIVDDKIFSIFITYKNNQMNIEKDKAYLILKPREKHIRKVLPLMGYPNGYSFDENKFLWFIGKDPNELEDITEAVETLLTSKNHEKLNDIQKAYFNYHFKIGSDNSIFEDILDSVGNPDFNNIDVDDFLFIDTCLEGEHIYNKNYETFKKTIKEELENKK